MGILEKLFGPAKKSSSGLFNQATDSWQVMKQALLRNDAAEAQSALLEVVRLCQEAVSADPHKEGNAYVLLTNALLRASQVYPEADEELLTSYAAACIHTWWTLPHKNWPTTSKTNQEIGIRWYQEIQQELRNAGSVNPQAAMVEYATLYGTLLTSPAGFETFKGTLEGFRGRLQAEIAHWSREAQRDPRDPAMWSILARKHAEAEQFKETERALLNEAALESRRSPDIKTADWAPNAYLGLLYTAALSMSIRSKGIIVWGTTPSSVTLGALGYALGHTHTLAHQKLERALHVARETGMAGVPAYWEMLARLRSALKAVDTMAISDFEECE